MGYNTHFHRPIVIFNFSLHQCVPGFRAEEAVEMLKTFYKQENPNGQFPLLYKMYPTLNRSVCRKPDMGLSLHFLLLFSFHSTKIKSSEKGMSKILNLF